MKTHWLPLVVAIFLVIAPVATAADGSASGSLEKLICQLVALFVGDELEIGEQYPPNGLVAASDEQEIGSQYPPNG